MKKLRKISKKKKTIIKIVLLVLLIVALFLAMFFGFKFLKNRLSFAVFKGVSKEIRVNIRNVYSDVIKQDLLSFVSTSTTKYSSNFDPILFYMSLKKNFKSIKKIEWSFSDFDRVDLSIVGVKPYCLINDRFVLGDKKRLFDKNVFEKFNFSGLYSAEINEDYLGEKLDKNIYLFLRGIPEERFRKFRISYHNDNEIDLILKESVAKALNISCDYLLRTNLDCFYDVEKFAMSDDLLKDIKKFGGKRKTVVLDLRFKKRIYAKK